MSERVTESDGGSLVVAAAVIVRSGRLLVVSTAPVRSPT
jgi:hypothetical protein